MRHYAIIKHIQDRLEQIAANRNHIVLISNFYATFNSGDFFLQSLKMTETNVSLLHNLLFYHIS